MMEKMSFVKCCCIFQNIRTFSGNKESGGAADHKVTGRGQTQGQGFYTDCKGVQLEKIV